MSYKIREWFEDRAQRRTLRSQYDQWYQREYQRQIVRMMDENNKWFKLQKQTQQQENQ